MKKVLLLLCLVLAGAACAETRYYDRYGYGYSGGYPRYSYNWPYYGSGSYYRGYYGGYYPYYRQYPYYRGYPYYRSYPNSKHHWRGDKGKDHYRGSYKWNKGGHQGYQRHHGHKGGHHGHHGSRGHHGGHRR